MELPQSEPFKDRAYLAEGWVYRDMPRVSPELFEEFVSIVGSDNLKWLSVARYSSPEGKSMRGQVLISPDGMEALKQWQAIRTGAASPPVERTPVECVRELNRQLSKS